MVIHDNEHADIPTPTGPMRTFIFRPVAPGHYPGLIVYSEIYQVTAPIRRIAAEFAGHGYIVAVPEIYHEFLPAGVAFHYDETGTARGNELKITKTIASYDDDARATLAYLKSHPNCTGKLGVAGFCIGGHLAFRAAMNPEVRATACWYPTDIHEGSLGAGKHDDSLARTRNITGEMLMIFGRQDPHVPDAGRRLIYDTMTRAGLSFTWHEVNAAHAFMRDEGARYDPALARMCYGLALEMFHRRLGEGDFQA
ncbi:MAG TPA: dienelactone hydrolase family protein [Candidatus Binataceae bacterium]|nr:dienelactone hydrolase family protein [Candidatus Binataceae bacterium]